MGHSRLGEPLAFRNQWSAGGGCKPLEPRQIFPGIVFVLCTGIQCKALPKTFGASNSIHGYFQEWRKAGFFKALWARGVAVYDEQKRINELD